MLCVFRHSKKLLTTKAMILKVDDAFEDCTIIVNLSVNKFFSLMFPFCASSIAVYHAIAGLRRPGPHCSAWCANRQIPVVESQISHMWQMSGVVILMKDVRAALLI